MRDFDREFKNPNLTGAVVVAIWLVVLWVLLATAHCQTVCVRDPLMAYGSRETKQAIVQQAEGWVQKQGFTTGCQGADLELLITPLQGSVDSGATYFVIQASDGVGTISLRPETYGFSSWLVQLFPYGRALSLQTRLGPNLRGNIKGVLKPVRNGRKSQKNL